MTKNSETLSSVDIPYHDFGGNGEVVHFAHANGYPPESYVQLIKPITQSFNVIGMYQRPLWSDSDYSVIKNWHQLADDMIQFFDQRGLKNVVGIGHSLGAVVSVLVATKRPDIFKKLILIEPVLFPKIMTTVNHLMPLSMRKKYVPVAKVAMRRRDHWSSQQEIFDSYRKKKIFSLMSDEAIWDWIKAGTIPSKDGGFTLRFTKEWEAHMYATVTYGLDAIDKLKIPFYIMKGERTNVISKTTWRRLHRKHPSHQLIEYKNTTHLLPIEQPVQVAEDILNIIKNK